LQLVESRDSDRRNSGSEDADAQPEKNARSDEHHHAILDNLLRPLTDKPETRNSLGFVNQNSPEIKVHSSALQHSKYSGVQSAVDARSAQGPYYGTAVKEAAERVAQDQLRVKKRSSHVREAEKRSPPMKLNFGTLRHRKESRWNMAEESTLVDSEAEHRGLGRDEHPEDRNEMSNRNSSPLREKAREYVADRQQGLASGISLSAADELHKALSSLRRFGSMFTSQQIDQAFRTAGQLEKALLGTDHSTGAR
jgi:hypothetical protein